MGLRVPQAGTRSLFLRGCLSSGPQFPPPFRMIRGPTQTEISRWTGKTRSRCKRCAKVVYATEVRADQAANSINTDHGKSVTMISYYEASCGWWHLTSVKGYQPWSRRR